MGYPTRNGHSPRPRQRAKKRGKRSLSLPFLVFFVLVVVSCLHFFYAMFNLNPIEDGDASGKLDALAYWWMFSKPDEKNYDDIVVHVPTGINADAAAVASKAADKVVQESVVAKLEDPPLAKNDSPLVQEDHTYSYSSIKHFPKNKTNSILIVGGSDGSGTRAVVETFMKLGAPFAIDDGGTLDVHGGEMFSRKGWPPVVSLVFKETHSAYYELENLSSTVRDQALAELQKLAVALPRKLNAPASKKIKARVAPKFTSSAVKLSWKAPVGMVLLPFLVEVFGDVKFVQVVRDGRDVALSDNQSPVNKFYNDYYGTNHNIQKTDTTNFAMQLWNDWNLQVHKWGMEHTDGNKVDYLMVRIEDLMTPEKKYETLSIMADYIGSSATQQDLCCLAHQQVKDLGKSTHFNNRKNLPGAGASKARLELEKHLPKHHSLRMEDDAQHVLEKLKQEGRKESGTKSTSKDKRDQHRTRRERIGREIQPPLGKRAIEERIQERIQERINMDREHKNVAEVEPKLEEKVALVEKQQQKEEESPKKVEEANDSLKKAESSGLVIRQLLAVDDPPPRAPPKRAPPRSETEDKVRQRYGKWATMLAQKPDVAAKLHELGAEGLKTFGYEPQIEFPSNIGESFQCDAEVVKQVCPQ